MPGSLRLGLRLAFSRDATQRWRQLSVVVGTMLGVLLFGFAASISAAGNDVDEHLSLRWPVWATSADDAALFITPRGFVHESHDITMLWLEPAPGHETDPDIIPPGLSRLPEPGSAVSSAAAAAIGLDPASLGLAPSDAGTGPDGTIGTEGLGFPSEVLIYLRPAEDRSLGEGGNLLPFSHYPSAATPGSSGFAADLPLGTAPERMFGSLLFLIIPATLLLAMSARAVSPARRARSEFLLRLGTSRTAVRTLLAVETAALALIGATLGAFVHVLVSQTITRIPFTGTTLHHGALAISPAVLGVCWALGLVLATAAGAAGPLIQSPRIRTVRQPSRWGLVPLLLGAAITALNGTIANQLGVAQHYVFALGVITLAIGVLLAIPVLTSIAGGWSGNATSPARWLGARRVVAAPRNLARPASLLALLLMLGGISVSTAVETVALDRSDAETRVMMANWRQPQPGDTERFNTSLAQIGATSLVVQNNDSDADYQQWLVVDSCKDLEPIADLTGPVCEPGGEVTAGASAWIEGATRLTIQPLDPAFATEGAVLILGPAGTAVVDVMRAGGGLLPAFNPGPLEQQPFVPTFLRWFVAGWIAATLVLSLTILRELGDRSLAGAVEEGRLLRLGLTVRESGAVVMWATLIPVMTALPLGYAAGLIVAWAGDGADITSFLLTPITLYCLIVVIATITTVLVVTPLRRSWARIAAQQYGRFAGPTLGVIGR